MKQVFKCEYCNFMETKEVVEEHENSAYFSCAKIKQHYERGTPRRIIPL